MDRQTLEQLLDCCMETKRIPEYSEALPKGMKPRHIDVLKVVYSYQNEEKVCRVSDVSKALGITTPSVTKLISELSEMRMLLKEYSPTDKREISLTLTQSGLECVSKYVIRMHTRWATKLDHLSDKEIETTLHVLSSLLDMVKKDKREQSL